MFQESDKGLPSFKGIKFFGKKNPKFAFQIMFELEKIDLEAPEQLFFIEYGPSFKAYA